MVIGKILKRYRALAENRRQRQEQAARLYACAVEAARAPVFYRDWGVPDTVEGRFEMVTLHVFFALYALTHNAASAQDRALAQALFDFMFADMDRSLREAGVGDLGVPRHVKRMAKAFYGRTVAYERALVSGDGAGLREAARKNIFSGAVSDAGTGVGAGIAEMAEYIQRCWQAVALLPAGVVADGRYAYPQPQEKAALPASAAA